ncbi:putative secreted RxLR effector protein [Phytophthora cinnamomi]|uniref:putative secreted RxLR effector protein n=1 Tax=Phytophthora cinnamomi TaxID=4785 RepID=UPI002A27280C|nr:putative secreted RxLR effector protein [Phytophthora cinnamomi]KAJ8563937.1 hypothetical protein ON010_g7413 [Phytophthora cinnamomi]
MRLQQALLVVIAAVSVSTIPLSAAKETETSTLEFPASGRSTSTFFDATNGRSLRVGKVTDTGDESAEDRGLWSSIKVRWWLELEKSDDQVKKALKLDGLEGAALTSHKNYNTYMKFAKKAVGYRVNKWYRKKYTTFQVWEEQGLGHVTHASQLGTIWNTEKFKVYERYVNYFDTNVLRTMKAGYGPPKLMLSRGATEAEMAARTLIMVRAGRPAKYAKLALGMTVSTYPRLVLMSGAKLESNADSKFFKLFLEKKKPALLKERDTLNSAGKLSSDQERRKSEVAEELALVEQYVPPKPVQ